MRITITLMIAAMTVMMIAGLVSVRILIPAGTADSRDIVLVMIDGCGEPELDRTLIDGDRSILKKLRETGILFQDCSAPSPWYPAAAASVMTGLNPAEHGLTAAHAHLSLRAETITENFFDRGYWTCAFVEHNSLLASTGVLQGFQRVIQDRGPGLVDRTMSYVGKHLGERPLLALLEVDARACGGARGVCTQMERIVNRLEEERFFADGGVLVLCAPGGSIPASEEAFGRSDWRDFVVIRFDGCEEARQAASRAPLSLAGVYAIVSELSRKGRFHENNLRNLSGCVTTEMALPPPESYSGDGQPVFPRFSRVVWFDDYPFRCFVNAAGEFEFQNDRFSPMRVDDVRESLARVKLENHLRRLEEIEDVNVSRSAGVKLSSALAAKLGDDWTREEFRLRPLHAVEHFRMGETLEEAGFDALAISEYRTALAIDRDFSRALFRIASAYAALDREIAEPYFQAYLRRFGDRPGEESFTREAREFMGETSAEPISN